ncbi:DUF3025 domain-containing protein [Comamonas sp. GB3 AK4-5]|uniref:DUF3025 domain-containing protein n=1 Tax=Comamonas sp. GB3 AK4-5 TaxID=3231487 RepID=UPI00351E9938
MVFSADPAGVKDADWQSVDWSQPWLAPLRTQGALLTWQLLQGGSVHAVLNSALPPALQVLGQCFVPQADLPAGMAYEAFIAAQRCVPTRDNFHDFFNGLVWLHYPETKRRLNALQAEVIAAQGVGAQRGPVRDAATLFDESGAVLHAPAPLWQALLARDWQALFLTHRDLWQHARLLVFGHALMEKLLVDRMDVTAQVLLAPPVGFQADRSIAPDDAAMAAVFTREHLARKPFTPLPLSGIPGWHASNAAAAFYANTAVFRPARRPMGDTVGHSLLM